jgi:bifunctional oligoribonuclease and PAP phosphatase NrnA
LFCDLLYTLLQLLFSELMQNIAAFKELISLPKRIVITTHVKPDADALGSSLGLAGFLQKIGHLVTVITPTDYPEFLNWMDGNKDVLIFGEETREKASYLVDNADIIFCLDFSSLDRIEDLGELVRQSEATKVLLQQSWCMISLKCWRKKKKLRLGLLKHYTQV